MESSCRLAVVSWGRAGISSDCNNQVGGAVEIEISLGWDDGGGAVFGDDGGAGIFFAELEFVAGVDFRFLFFAFE